MKKHVASVVVVVVVAVGVVGLVGGASARQPVATASKVCSAYAEEHFGDVTTHLPDGTKCIGPGEYCSHKPGYARAYKKAGLRCDAEGRLVRR